MIDGVILGMSLTFFFIIYLKLLAIESRLENLEKQNQQKGDNKE